MLRYDRWNSFWNLIVSFFWNIKGYCTRYQRERVQKDGEQKCVIDVEFMRRLKPDAIVMHPLPRNSEIDPRVDNDKRCVYFEQMRNGVELRKALLLKCFDKW